jgi:hypothetical protein
MSLSAKIFYMVGCICLLVIAVTLKHIDIDFIEILLSWGKSLRLGDYVRQKPVKSRGNFFFRPYITRITVEPLITDTAGEFKFCPL